MNGYLFALVLVAFVTVFLVQYFRGRALRRVVSWGKDTYVRFYPNPGVSFCYKDRRVAVSSVGGLEFFKRLQNGTWRRTAAFLSRIPSRYNGGV